MEEYDPIRRLEAHGYSIISHAEVKRVKQIIADLKSQRDMLAGALQRFVAVSDKLGHINTSVQPEDCPSIQIEGHMCYQCAARTVLMAYATWKHEEELT